MRVEFDEIKVKGRFSGKSGERKGSRKFVILLDEFGESRIRWWNNEWRFSSVRINRKISGSLMRGSLVDSLEKGREIKDEERFGNFGEFSKRIVGIVGEEEFMKIVMWIKS